MHPRDQKNELRHAIKDRIAHLSDTLRKAESRSLCRRIIENLPKTSGAICAYYPLKDEADLRPLILALQKLKYTVFLPKYEEGKLVFRQCENLDHLKAGRFDIPEPPTESPLLNPKDLLVALVPGRAFTKKGERLGRGNGGYDMWIRQQRQQNPNTKYWGVAFDCQIVNEIPIEEHDEKIDAVVTARGLTMCP